MNIAILGRKGSFHHQVANTFFGDDIALIECTSFKEISKLVALNVADGAVMAVENSKEGALLSNYHLIDSNNLNIQGEVYLPVIHNLIALPGQQIQYIKEVKAHPTVIENCRKFFKSQPHIRIIEEKDIADTAKMIRNKKLKGVAVIGSEKVSEIYGLDIIKDGIQTDKTNMTRYVALKKQRHHHAEDYLNNKASLKFITKVETLNLAEILTVLADHNLKLAKVQSMPIAKEPWNSSFFIDVTFEDYHMYCQALLSLVEKVKELKILGEYRENKPVFAKTTAKKQYKHSA